MSGSSCKAAHVYAKSASKTYSKDIYFPALGSANNVNFPFSKIQYLFIGKSLLSK